MATQPNVLGCEASPLQGLPFPPRKAAAALKARAAAERSNGARRKVKIDRAAGVLDRLEARAKVFDLEIKALQTRKALTC